MARKTGLPKEVRRHLEVLEDALRRTLEGAPTYEVSDDVLRAAENAHAAAQTGATPRDDLKHNVVTFGSLIADRLRRLRDEAGWTQTRLAEAMTEQGFDWKRITVAEIERRGDDPDKPPRRVTLEELFTLSALYGEPMMLFLTPGDGDYLKLADGRSIDPGVATQLITGNVAPYFETGADWEPARTVALGSPNARLRKDRRPARDLEERRSAGYGRGLRKREEGDK